MEFGVFYQLPCAQDQSPVGRYHDTIAQAQLAEALGFHTVWLAELHFHPRFSIMSAPLLVAAAMAQTTQRIKLGTAVNLMPLHYPIRLAEETATLDILSHGRAIFGIGRGIIPSHFEGYGVSYEEGRQRFEEALDLILAAWTSDTLSYQGQHYQAQDVQVTPKPYQHPHPPIAVAATGPDTFNLVGSRGYQLLVTPMISSTERTQEGLGVYRQAFLAHAHNPAHAKVTITVPVYVADNPHEAYTAFTHTINHYLNTLREMLMHAPAAIRAAKVNPRIAMMQEGLAKLSAEQIYEEFAVVGAPEQCVAKLQRFQQLFEPQEVMCWFNTGGMLPPHQVEQSMRLFAQDVMPHFRG